MWGHWKGLRRGLADCLCLGFGGHWGGHSHEWLCYMRTFAR